jgi:hypothetical protein
VSSAGGWQVVGRWLAGGWQVVGRWKQGSMLLTALLRSLTRKWYGCPFSRVVSHATMCWWESHVEIGKRVAPVGG